MSVLTKIKKLTSQLFPSGRAFKIPIEGEFKKLMDGLAESENRAYLDALSIYDSAIPDNNNFTSNDASDWERRLGLITNTSVSLSDRKMAIIRKMNFPGVNKARQNYRFLEKQLQDAGFNLYVFENRFPDGMGGYVTQNPVSVGGSSFVYNHGMFNHGMFNHGISAGQIIANSLDNQKDLSFNLGSNLKSTFFIGGFPLGTIADVDEEREIEFRQLVLKLKPQQTVAFLLVNYI